MKNSMLNRKCAVCGEIVKGRSDKRFCSSKCKNQFHYGGGKLQEDVVKEVNRFLIQNRKILIAIFEGEKKNKLMVPRILLDKMGFHFNYMTGIYRNREDKLYHYIYDYAWMEFSSQEVMIVKKKK